MHVLRALVASLTLSLSLGGLTGVSSAGATDAWESFGSVRELNSATPSGVRPMADLTLFRPGNIISDATFFDSSTMSSAQIQAFLQSKAPTCRSGYTCLASWTDTSRTIAADAMCGPYAGAANEKASEIIYKVAQACGINPRVLLVMLQKEQGLVTHTWPSDWRYTIAMGQGCPDTAACDTRYYGFFNQVHGAAWQLKRYANPPGTNKVFTWFAPGKTANVRFSPDAACGSAQVYIENQATANLYYYTPYQPNVAALRAGYGEGDGCSAYGNRNFYNYFVDWFGSTQVTGATLARSASNPAVYLISGLGRWGVPDPEDYVELSRAFGAAAVVSDAYLATLTLRGNTRAVLHNAATGVMSLVQGGALHRILTCESAAAWGASCGSPTTVSPALLAGLAAGPDVGSYFTLRTSGVWGRFDSASAVTPLYNEAAARAVNGDMRVTPFAPYLPTSRYAELAKSALVFAPGQLVRATTDARVYMTADFDRLLSVNAWSDVVEYNRFSSSVASVPSSDLARYREAGPVTPTLRCPSGSYLLTGGALHRLSDPLRAGLLAVDAAEITCAQFPLGSPASTAVALRAEDEDTVFVLEHGQRRRAMTWEHLVDVNGGSAPVILVTQSTTLQSIPYGPPIADGLLTKGTSPAVAMVNGTSAHWLESFDIARELGVPTTYRTLGDSEVSALTLGVKLGLWVDCGGNIGFAASGRVYPVTPIAAKGFTPVALSPLVCKRLAIHAGAPGPVFVKSSGSATVYAAENGIYRSIGTWAELVGLAGTTPRILVLSASTLASLPRA